MTTYEGRLELTWTNKHLPLLAHEDGSYEWVPPADYRVAEVRLLTDADAVGDVRSRRAANSLLVRGDSPRAKWGAFERLALTVPVLALRSPTP